MRAPAFWWRARPTAGARALQPLGAVYGALTAARMDRAGARAGIPVVCIGNLVVGGAGKTPTAMAVARLLQQDGETPAFLSRGYGRRRAPGSDAVLRVDADRHGVNECGDEPLLLARVAPTFVSADRVAAAAAAVAAGASLLILDDGLQNPSLAKDLSIAVVDGAAGIGNGLCLPAGPLRAPLGRQWPHVALLCVVGDGEPGRALAAQAAAAGVVAITGRLDPGAAALQSLRGRRLYAFAGIGRPEKFFDTLGAHALDVVGRRAFPDHHAFTAAERQELLRAATRLDAVLVTTEKDRVRLPSDFPAATLPVDLVLDDPGAIARPIAAMRERHRPEEDRRATPNR